MMDRNFERTHEVLGIAEIQFPASIRQYWLGYWDKEFMNVTSDVSLLFKIKKNSSHHYMDVFFPINSWAEDLFFRSGAFPPELIPCNTGVLLSGKRRRALGKVRDLGSFARDGFVFSLRRC